MDRRGVTHGPLADPRQHGRTWTTPDRVRAGRYLAPMAGEPTILVERRKELTYLLSQGAELEHSDMCEYLYAAFSLRSTPGAGLSAAQLPVVERWHRLFF